MNVRTIVLLIFQIACVVILLPAAYWKLTGNPNDIILFTELGMEPYGRVIIGLVELVCSLFLLTSRMAAIGAALANATMLGAIIAHASILGINVLGDEGKHVLLLTVVFTSSLIIIGLRRKQLPLIGNTFE
jgi:putative oxidoreductase